MLTLKRLALILALLSFAFDTPILPLPRVSAQIASIDVRPGCVPDEPIHQLQIWATGMSEIREVAYRLRHPSNIRVLGASYGPDGLASGVETAEGTIVDLGSCVELGAGEELLVAEITILRMSVPPDWGLVRAEPHGSLSRFRPAFRGCVGDWTEANINLPSCLCDSCGMTPPYRTYLTPESGESLVGGQWHPVTWFYCGLPILIAFYHEYSLDGGNTWSRMIRRSTQNAGGCAYSEEWWVPEVSTDHARIRRTTDREEPDPGHPELEFSITVPVTSRESTLGSLKGLFQDRP